MSTLKPSILKDIVQNESTSMLEHCVKIQSKCAQIGFDWPCAEPCFDKVEEELAEIKEALANPSKTQSDVIDEVGDLLFASINLCRHLNVSPDMALNHAQQKFIKRFQLLEVMADSENKDIAKLGLAELESYWVAAKARLD